MVTAFVVCLMCHVLFPTREDQSASSGFPCQFADVSLDSLPVEAKYCPLRQGVPKRFVGERRRSHELEVCALEGVSSKIDTTENCFSSHSSKKSSVPDSPANRCRSSEKATANGFAVGDRDLSSVSIRASPGSCPQTAAIVACQHLILLMVTSARAGSTFHLCRSCALVQLRPWLSVAVLSYALPFERALRYLHIFLSSR